MRTKFLIIFAVVIAILASSFAFQNTQVAELKFLTWSLEMPVLLLIFFSFGAGFVLALLIALPGSMAQKMREFRLRFKVRSLESKVTKKDKIIEGVKAETQDVPVE